MIALLDVVLTFRRIGFIGLIGIMEMIGLDALIVGSDLLRRACQGQHVLVRCSSDGSSGSVYQMERLNTKYYY